ncbi:FAD-dependent oxidoreductase [Hydrogenophaga sp. 5NK40-0174]|uniref:NAD(P)/FAD-dependent oxidoreductase n=1 Tax=Hydrogenophaga sp. 5NK40-0174 TaxID=3127649 RepID=UPI003105DA07
MSKPTGDAPGMVIVGAGQAGVQAAEALRAGGYEGSVTLLGDEPYGPYHRPPLSKAWLAGEMDAAQLMMRAPDMLARKNIDLRTRVSVASIDRPQKLLHLKNGSVLPYDGLVLATGSTPRSLNIPGADTMGVLALRSRDDANAISDRMTMCAEQSRPVVVIGGGFIGLEVAATARQKDLLVTVLESAPRLLGRVLSPSLSDWYARLHTGHGVTLMLNTQCIAIEHDEQGVTGVRLSDGSLLPAGLVVVGVGVLANDAMARKAGLPCDRGIIVDACGRTDDPFIVAAGDCTARRLSDGSLLRLESVQNATEQGKSAASALLGQERPFTATPWFWSDQFDKKLQMAGLSMGADHWAVRGDMDAGTGFSVYHFAGDRLIAVDSINSAREHLQARKLLDAGVSPTVAQATDTGFDLASLLKKA